MKKFRTSSDICKYDCSLEESFLREVSNSESKRYSVRNEEIVKTLSELETTKTTTTTTTPTRIEPLSDDKSTDRKSSVAHLRMKAQTVAELYLGVDDTAKVLNFLDFYVNLMEKYKEIDSNNTADDKIAQVFELFEGDLDKSGNFLIVSEELEELGFESEKVTSALMLFSNDRESALDFLMKN